MFGLGVRGSISGPSAGSKSLLGIGLSKPGLGSSPLGAGIIKAPKPAHLTEQAELSMKLLEYEESLRGEPEEVITAPTQERHQIGESDSVSTAQKVTTSLALEAGTAGASSSTATAGTAEARILKRRGAAPQSPEELAAVADAAAARNLPAKAKAPNPDPDPNADWDFDFSGNGRPYRFARGKATRLLSGTLETQAGREAVRRARAQLQGKAAMELGEVRGIVRHVGPNSPFSSLGECGHPDCGAHRIFRPVVRSRFRDFIVDWVCKAQHSNADWCGQEGLRYASLGSGQLLFDLELLERLRGKGIRIAQICLIDKAYQQPTMDMRRVLREFADWQRAVAFLDREKPAEIFAFGHSEEYEVAAKKGTVAGCHLFVHCIAYWENALPECDRLAKQALTAGGLLARLNPEPFLFSSSTQKAEAAQSPQAHSDAPCSAAAWSLKAGDRSLQYLEDDLLHNCVVAIAATNAERPAGDVPFAKQRAREEMKIRDAAKAKHNEEIAETKRVEAEIHAHNRRVDAENAKVLAQQDKLVRAKEQRVELIRMRQEASLAKKKATPSEPPKSFQQLMEQRRARVSELEEKGWSLWKVGHEEVNVHVTPNQLSRILVTLDKGAEVVAGQVHDQWLQIAEDPEGVELPPEAWVRHDGSASGHGALLSQIHAKDFDISIVDAPRRAG